VIIGRTRNAHPQEKNLNKLHRSLLLIALGAVAPTCSAANVARVAPVGNPPALKMLDAHSPARVLRTSDGVRYQWPGVYFEAAFRGPKVFFKVGAGDVILRVLVDGTPVATLVKPAAGTYEIANLAKKAHTVRIESVTESLAAPNVFGGLLYSKGTQPLPMPPRARQIEFIGDSHTVGYGNTSTTRDCSDDDVWKTTDSTQAFGPKMARHYGADYQVNAISGRGVVRNYDGGAGDALPEAYPYVLLDHSARYEGRSWRPQVIVIALGTNDFTTALHPAEKWKSRDELHADFAATYLRFLQELRARNPGALMVVWATDMAEGEIESEVGKVVESFRSAGDKRITFVPIDGLGITGCHWHPSIADDDAIANALMRVIDGNPDTWG
jgi:lysophospholipase L1-like esterase